VFILAPQHLGWKSGIPGDLWRAGGARAYPGIWGRAPSGVQGQSPWWGSGRSPLKLPWSWKLFGSCTSHGTAKFTPFSIFCCFFFTVLITSQHSDNFIAFTTTWILTVLGTNLKNFCFVTINCLQRYYFSALETLRMHSTSSFMYVCMLQNCVSPPSLTLIPTTKGGEVTPQCGFWRKAHSKQSNETDIFVTL